MSGTFLQRLHIGFVAILVLGSFGGWALSFLDDENSSSLVWGVSMVSWFGSVLFLAVLGIALERACVIRGPSWVAMGVFSCVPIVRVFVEVSMVTAMARIAGAFVDDQRLERRARRLMIARVVVVVAQYVLPVFLIMTMRTDGGGLTAFNWFYFAAAISIASIVLLAVATYIVVAPVVEALRDGARPNVGGAGAQESVAVRTL